MPDAGLADGSVLTSANYDTYIRQQVVAQVTSGTRPTGVEGRLIAETDTNLFQVYNGTAWQGFGAFGASTTYTPTTTNVTTPTATGRYIRYGRMGWFNVAISAGTATAANVITLTLPSGWTGAAFSQVVSGAGPANVGVLCYVASSATVVTVQKGIATVNWTAADSAAFINVAGFIELG